MMDEQEGVVGGHRQLIDFHHPNYHAYPETLNLRSLNVPKIWQKKKCAKIGSILDDTFPKCVMGFWILIFYPNTHSMYNMLSSIYIRSHLYLYQSSILFSIILYGTSHVYQYQFKPALQSIDPDLTLAHKLSPSPHYIGDMMAETMASTTFLCVI